MAIAMAMRRAAALGARHILAASASASARVISRRHMSGMDAGTAMEKIRAAGLLRTRGLIGGKWVDAYDGKTIEPAHEEDEEENSFNRNDNMSDMSMPDMGDDPEGEHIYIFDDENSGDADMTPQRGRKHQKGVKVEPKVAVQVGSKQTSDVWNNFEKVLVPSMTEKGVMILKAQYLLCQKFYSYTQEGCTTHLGRHMRACAAYKNMNANKKNQDLNYAPSKADLLH